MRFLRKTRGLNYRTFRPIESIGSGKITRADPVGRHSIEATSNDGIQSAVMRHADGKDAKVWEWNLWLLRRWRAERRQYVKVWSRQQAVAMTQVRVFT